jgi:hypothetical protein
MRQLRLSIDRGTFPKPQHFDIFNVTLGADQCPILHFAAGQRMTSQS